MFLLNRVKKFLQKKNEYKEYIDLQLNRSKSKYNSVDEFEIKRKEYLIDLLSKMIDLKEIDRALIIGCRNSYELDLLENKGVKSTIGVDLFSFDKRVKVMDMHRLKFKNGLFDLVYCSHSLEHACDYQKVVSEITRVLKKTGIIVIEVPINYETRGSDLHDFKSSEKLLSVFSKYVEVDTIYINENVKAGSKNNLSGTNVARLIFKIKAANANK